MTDNFTALPSRRAQREARAAAERSPENPYLTPSVDVSAVSATELPSRRSRRAQPSGIPHDYDGHNDVDGWITASPSVGRSSVAISTLHVEQFPTGEISGPIDHTGEIILTGPIMVAGGPNNRSTPLSINASPSLEGPGIPRRATEALSIIGRASPMTEIKMSSSTGRGISAGFATFLGLVLLTLIGLAFFTDLI